MENFEVLEKADTKVRLRSKASGIVYQFALEAGLLLRLENGVARSDFIELKSAEAREAASQLFRR